MNTHHNQGGITMQYELTDKQVAFIQHLLDDYVETLEEMHRDKNYEGDRNADIQEVVELRTALA